MPHIYLGRLEVDMYDGLIMRRIHGAENALRAIKDRTDIRCIGLITHEHKRTASFVIGTLVIKKGMGTVTFDKEKLEPKGPRIGDAVTLDLHTLGNDAAGPFVLGK